MSRRGARRLEPAEALRLVSGAMRGRLSIPLSLLDARLARWSDKAKLTLESAAPGLRLRGNAHALGAPISFAARIDLDGVRVDGEARTVRISLSDVELTTPNDAPGPLAEAIRDGMIDTTQPATLIGNMVSLPDFIVSTAGNEITIDLMRLPWLARDDELRTRLAAATSYVGVRDIRTTADAIELRFGVLPGGAREAALSTARAALLPAMKYLWPDERRRP